MLTELIRVVDVHRVYRLGSIEVQALRGISFYVNEGEMLCIMGPSGSGKTTLLNIMGTLDKPTKGRVYIEGKDITKLGDRELTNLRLRKIGFVFQFYNLIPVLTAFENVELPMIFAGVSRKERKRRAVYLLELVGLGNRMNHRPDELSGGEQQRVAIARALANRPKIILADEPTGELDTENGKKIMNIFRKIVDEERVSVIIATHDPIVSEFSDRIIRIRDGIIVSDEKIR